eukprot:TRINITY_DN3026_c0_g1_i2.p1 TRINITY_DN3026_c0_g1~~TRINITY_DN3026_c0_g1_i2.p1  ORF type:complete len:307 (+),score=46.18 TRINITY_DN3026_c0_g1_i2:52-972(+)
MAATLDNNSPYITAAQALLDAEYLIICAGAGMSVECGMAVYKDVADIPAYKAIKKEYFDLCKPTLMKKDPELFYGFWGKCYNDYVSAIPQEGYRLLRQWCNTYFGSDDSGKYFIYTSNVDGLFNKAGFEDKVVNEIHGNALYMQCSRRCTKQTWKLDDSFRFKLDPETMKLAKENGVAPFPKCRNCDRNSRPNVLMFDDNYYFRGKKMDYFIWEDNLRKLSNEESPPKIVPVLRSYSESFIRELNNVTLIRINPDFPDLDKKLFNEPDYERKFNFIPIKDKGMDALIAIDQYLKKPFTEKRTTSPE